MDTTSQRLEAGHEAFAYPAPWLDALEDRVQAALVSGSAADLDVMGYGEITIVLRADTPSGPLACKRLPVFQRRGDAEAYGALIGEYIEALEHSGVNVARTSVHILERDNGGAVLYCAQEILPGDRLGPNYFRALAGDDAVAAFGQILDCLESSVTDRLAPDGQLSNWVFLDAGLLYLDITTPMMRGADGRNRIDWAPLLKNLPAPFRPYARRRIPYMLDFYHSLRGQVLDFLANLRKEGLDHLYPALLPYAAERLKLEPPVDFDAVRAYYRENARDYVLLERAKRIDRWVHRNVLRRTYHNLLPPAIERNPFP